VNTLRVFGELGQMSPKMLRSLDNVDEDKLFKEIWYANSSSMNALKEPERVAEERQAEQEAMQKQQAINNLAPVADAAQKLSGKTDPSSIIAQAGQ